MSGSGTVATSNLAERGISRVVSLPPPSPGFVGEGHTAIHVIDAREFQDNDPFIMLADDRLDIPRGQRAGGPHPHAGFEIVTFAVDGDSRDRDEGLLRAGDVLWMTAGSGVIHNEDFEPQGKVRILQLWVTLPNASRWLAPRFERFAHEDAMVRREPGVEARVYSGTSGSVRATWHTYLPLTMIDIRLASNAAVDQELPASYNGFIYPLDGELLAGRSAQRLEVGQIGWLDAVSNAQSTNVRLGAGNSGARVVLWAGERQGVPIVTHGPFVGETRADLVRVSQDYAQGRMPRVSELRPR